MTFESQGGKCLLDAKEKQETVRPVKEFGRTVKMASLRSQESFPIRVWELIAYVIITVAGIFGNSLVLGVLKQNKQMRETAFGIYIASLAVADIFVCVLCLPVYITSTSAFKAHPTGLSGDIVCKLWTSYFALFYFAVISVYTLVALSVERYFAICHPVKAKVHSTPTKAKKIVLFIWLLSFIPNFALIAGLKEAGPESASFGAHCTAIVFDNEAVWVTFYILVLTMQYVLPITSMVVCFVKIKKALHVGKMNALIAETPHVQAGQLAIIRSRKKTVRTIIIMILSYFACWSLNQVLYFLLNIGYGVPFNGDLMQFSVVMCFFSSCINPVIYTLRTHQFRDGFTNIIYCHKKRRTVSLDATQTHTRDGPRPPPPMGPFFTGHS